MSAGQPVLQQGSQVVLGKSPQVNAGTVQTRVRPVSGTQASRQTIQVVPGTAIRAVPNVTIDASGRSQVSVSSTLASALTGSIKVAQSATSTQQAFLSQVCFANTMQKLHFTSANMAGKFTVFLFVL